MPLVIILEQSAPSYIFLTKTTAALSYRRLRGLYFLAVVFVRSIGYTFFRIKQKTKNPKMVPT